MAWCEALYRAKSVGTTYKLALTILSEEFKTEYTGDDIVLSTEKTGMSKKVRIRAARELEKLGLIKLRRKRNGQAFRISIII
jgi:hypothetical protein